MIHISLPDESKLEITPGASLAEVAQVIGPGLAKAAVCADVDGTLRDLREQVSEDATVTFFTRGSQEALSVLRHTTTHIMAQAVKRLFPEAQLGIGPAIEDGFYYDFAVDEPFTPEQLTLIEDEMRKIIATAYPIERLEVSRAEAEKVLSEQNESLKVELLADLDDETITMFRQGEFIDLCRGPHLKNTGEVKKEAFKLLSVAGAYWRGDESRSMLQRIYGTAWESKKDLASHLEKLEQIEARDHRKLIKQLDLVSFHEEAGAGLAYWHPKGGRMRVIIEDYWRKLHYQGGYDIVFTPHIGRGKLWETSGHLDFYRDGMYAPMDVDGQDYYIKPMNCPFHIMIYKSRTRSYRDLPLRWAELGTVYRYERSGTLHGLLRVRGFTQDDAHIFCTPDQVEDEILRVLDFSLNLLRGFGFEEFKIELSVRDPNKPDKYAGEDAMWEQAEASLVKALDTRDLPYKRMEGEAVFYGPKIDIKIKDALNRTWQCTTIQFDFNLPGRFDMSYIGEDGAEHRPYMIHRALLGSLERFFGILVEHYAGAFPVWLAPVQAMVIPISDRHNDYARQVGDSLKSADLRADIDTSSGRMNAKIRSAQMEKIPYMLVVGDKEIESGSVAVRLRSGEDLGAMPLDDLVAMIKRKVEEKALL
ncbi:MAG: threonine--tRNA ligase [Candidatus Bipolaricaulota bacterium]|nr:threonine--tRNA ligase [Candidatus Bipolaricaulota bacterium]